jgi:hypothetical protein
LSFPDSGIENHINQLGVYNTHRTSRKGYVGSVSNAASAFTMILTDLGYQTKMIATAQIESGALSDYKVLVLPFSQCLTEQEITAIRAFVEGGGLLIADYRCGVRDPHGNLRQDGGTLDELFGIRQSPGNVVHQGCRVSERFGIRDKGGIWACQAIGQTVTGGPLDVRRPAEPPAPGAVQPTSLGEADDGTPVFVVNTCGKGVTLYLNFAVDSYLALRPKGLGAEFRELLEPVVSVFGQVGPPARVVRRQPGYRDFRAYVHPPEIGVEVTRFRDGTAEYVSLLWDYMRNDWGRHEVVVHFAYPAHTYDVIAGAYLGFRSEVDLNIEGCPVRLLARMPYEVLQVKIVPPASHPAAGKAVAFHVDVVAGGNATPGRHVFWTMLLDPQGRPVEGMGASVVAERGHASVSWSPAYNDPPGVYTLTCRDVTSGVEASTRISLSEVPAHPSPIQ